MDKELKLPAILFLWLDIFPSLRVTVLNLLERLVIELVVRV